MNDDAHDELNPPLSSAPSQKFNPGQGMLGCLNALAIPGVLLLGLAMALGTSESGGGSSTVQTILMFCVIGLLILLPVFLRIRYGMKSYLIGFLIVFGVCALGFGLCMAIGVN